MNDNEILGLTHNARQKVKTNHPPKIREYISESQKQFLARISSPFMYISEDGPYPTFLYRERISRGDYSEERALQAFEDYKKHREFSLIKKTEGQKILDKKFGSVVLHPTGVAPIGGEYLFRCLDQMEAMARVLELIGPAPKESRNLIPAKFDLMYSGLWCGFRYVITTGPRVGLSTMFRIDWDPQNTEKGAHFNVEVLPPRKTPFGELTGRQLSSGDPLSLNIAFCFPADKAQKDQLTDEIFYRLEPKNNPWSDIKLGYLPTL